jgi:hypothetical protein
VKKEGQAAAIVVESGKHPGRKRLRIYFPQFTLPWPSPPGKGSRKRFRVYFSQLALPWPRMSG